MANPCSAVLVTWQIGSMEAAAANSSVKLSTAKTLAIFPGARRFERRRGVSFNQCTTTRTFEAAYGGSPFCEICPAPRPCV